MAIYRQSIESEIQEILSEEFIGTPADFKYWAEMSRWTIDEAVMLSFGFEPEIGRLEVSRNDLAIEIKKHLSWARRAVEASRMTSHASPSEFATFFMNCQRQFSPAMLSAIEASVLMKEKSKSDDDRTDLNLELSPKAKTSFQKMILGMAIKGYAYQPGISRSTVPKEIASDLRQIGLELSAETILKHLQEARESLDFDLDLKSVTQP